MAAVLGQTCRLSTPVLAPTPELSILIATPANRAIRAIGITKLKPAMPRVVLTAVMPPLTWDRELQPGARLEAVPVLPTPVTPILVPASLIAAGIRLAGVIASLTPKGDAIITTPVI